MNSIIEDLDLHDALIESADINFASGSILIKATAYKDRPSTQRSPLSIHITGAKSIVISADLMTIRDNGRSGNINHFVIDHDRNVAHMYFVDGILSTSFDRFSFCWGDAAGTLAG